MTLAYQYFARKEREEEELGTIEEGRGTIDSFCEPTPVSIFNLSEDPAEVSVEAQKAKIFEVLEDLSQVNPVLNQVIDFIALYRENMERYPEDKVLEWVLKAV